MSLTDLFTKIRTLSAQFRNHINSDYLHTISSDQTFKIKSFLASWINSINRKHLKMPEILVYVRALLFGFIFSEIWHISKYSAIGLYDYLDQLPPLMLLICFTLLITIILMYAYQRGTAKKIERIWVSKRIDLLIAVLLGIISNINSLTYLDSFHKIVKTLSPIWSTLASAFILLLLISSVVIHLLNKKKTFNPQLLFLTDDEIYSDEDNIFSNREQLIHFAETVLVSDSEQAIVYGIEGPWGVGKTSFLNLVRNYWNTHASNKVIVFRFELLRYSTDSNLVDRLIKDISDAIQREVFVPELRPAANRYSRMLKGNADFSFLGFKLSLSPSRETVDELLDDIDSVLEQINRKMIIIIDDLDRLDSTSINNILFAVRRTFKLRHLVYILCFDNERLLATGDYGKEAHQFLEKFINIKLSLFIDSADLTRFLKEEWKYNEYKYPLIPSETMIKLQAILQELADLIDGDHATDYLILIGDIRKIKRFVNAAILMQIDKTEFSQTDFNKRDLINLIILNLSYPEIFRRIYIEETRNRTGIFSITSKGSFSEEREYVNHPKFSKYLKKLDKPARFLLSQLFDTNTLELGIFGSIDEDILSSRACFNHAPRRNLEKYLDLIVNFSKPHPTDSFVLYKNSVLKVIDGTPIRKIFEQSEFDLRIGNKSHDEFWRILVSQSYDLNKITAHDSINTLVDFLPKYSIVDLDDRSLRQRSIYTLIRLLDRAGWGRTDRNRRNNSKENIIEIAQHIFGEHEYQGKGLIFKLTSNERNVLGFYDLVLFRLNCNADRKGQNYNLQNSLILHENIDAETTGPVTKLAIEGMRRLSQHVFLIFKERYIDPKKNIFDDIDNITNEEFFGEFPVEIALRHLGDIASDRIEATRSAFKSFIVYQLINKKSGTGDGVGCGFYDQSGDKDKGEIAHAINSYLFEVCFNPEISPTNIEHFLDYCLRNFTSSFWSDADEDGYHPTIHSLSSELDVSQLMQYWAKYGESIKNKKYPTLDTRVVTFNYIAYYKDELPKVFNIFDNFQAEYNSDKQEQRLVCKSKGVVAYGNRSDNGFIVFKGSQAVIEGRTSEITKKGSHYNRRKRLLEEGILKQQYETLIFTQDYEFTSPYTAASTVVGGPTNGLTMWKSKSGETLKEIESKV